MSSNHSDRNYGKPLFQEVSRWSLGIWLFALLLDISIIFAVWVALPLSATYLTVLLLITLNLYLLYKTTMRITVTQGWLLVGTAAIERAFIYNFKILDSKEMKLERGLKANPLNFLEIRFWIPKGMKMEIRDPRDKTPAWIISSRETERLLQVLSKPEH